jgi:cytochrome c oxidase cbb3-type subunit I/II
VGGKYPNVWHYRHMENPRSISVGSNMPNYPWLLANPLDLSAMPSKISVQRTLGVPYPNWTPEQITAQMQAQAKGIADNLKQDGVTVAPDREIIALISYLQKLGKFEAVAPRVAAQ